MTAVFVVGITVGLVAPRLVGTEGGGESSDRATVELVAVAAEKRTISAATTYAGTLAFGSSVPINAGRDGTITDAASEGTELTAGDVLAMIDDDPVIVIYGQSPMFRDLDTSADPGPDITQLETFLVAGDYDADQPLTIDDTFTGTTRSAVRAWQDATDQDVTGTVAVGTLIAQPGPLTVTETATVGTVLRTGSPLATVSTGPEVTTIVAPSDGAVTGLLEVGAAVQTAQTAFTIADTAVAVPEVGPGAAVTARNVEPDQNVSAGRPVLDIVTPTPGTVTVSAAADSVSDFTVGNTVEIELSSGDLVDATVTEVARTAQSDGQGGNSQPTVAITIVLDPLDAAVSDRVVAGPVDVRVLGTVHADVVAVPTRALVALREGGQGVEVRNADGTTRLVGVETGLFADGWVEVTGDTAGGAVVAGTEVLVPG
ncbi:MAG: HlyD family efflux transporter periplasmic adaptor subunit [Acidimicrobiales bacterium]